MFCYFSHIIEERYFDELEVMFLIVGHTHNILDQWFSVLAKAIRNAHFIGSVIAIHELYKIAHNEKKEHLRPALVHQMRTFHDWRRMYAPVLNEDIHNYGIPHRFKFTIDDQIGVAMMQYMPFSPPYGLKLGEKWHPTPTELGVRNTRVDGDIVLTPLMVFNGPDEVLKALGAKDQTTSDLAVGTQKERDAADDINHIMPILRELEVRAVGESAIRMQQEADVGASEETVTVSFTTLKQIEQLISKGNAKKDGNGRIVWLRRSKIAATDPNWLDKRPDVLPNPRLWNERIANAPVPVVPVNTTGEQPPTVVPAETPAQATIRKKLTADATESQLRLLNFQKAAADIAVTSSHIIKLVEKSGGIELSAKTNIKDATNNFQKAVLTTREHFWYKANCNGRQITAATEALVAVEEAKPWKLLDFPEITPEQKRHMAEIARLRAETAAQVEANLRGLLLRPGEGEYDPTLQVINFDGFAAAETKDVSKMLRAALVGIAKTFMKMAPGEIKKLNVEQLREKVKAYVALHPDVVQFPSQQAILASQAATAAATAESESTDPSPSQAQGADSGSAAPVTEQPSSSSDSRREPETCCVIECEGVARPMVRCPECELVFCVELHGPHSSHSLQTLRAGSIPHHTMEIVLPEDTINSEIASDASPLISESSEPEREREPEIIAEPMADEPDVPVVVPDVITRACKRLLPPQAPGPESISTSQPARESILDTDASEPEAHLLLVQPPSAEQTVPSVPPVTKMRRLEGDNPSHREHLEVTKLEDAVGFIRELRRLRVIQGRPAMYDRIHLLSKYRSESCYDIAFLYQLGKEFGVDMSVVMKTKRQSHKVVLEYLVSKLFVD
jgi:hypothetical protein